MSLTDEEFEEKASNLIADVATNILSVLSPKSLGTDDLFQLHQEWKKYSQDFFLLLND